MRIEESSARNDNRSFEERAWDLWGEMLLEKETEQLLLEIEEEKHQPIDLEIQKYLKKRDQLNLAMIHRRVRKQKLVSFISHGMPRLLRVAAVVLAVLTVTGTIALATSATFRVEVMKLLAITTPEYTELKLVPDDEASFEVPVEWKGDNYLSYIPEGFVMKKILSNSNTSSVDYLAAENEERWIHFSEYNSAGSLSIDSEEAVKENEIISGHNGTILIKGYNIIIYWTDGYHTFLVRTSGLNTEQALRIARGLRPIK